jgi:hypothetical protein
MNSRVGLLVLALCVVSSGTVVAGTAAAQPTSGPRETVNQSFTAKRPNAATGVRFSSRYHAAGDEKGNPPYLRRMVFTPPRGMRYDTSVPELCTAPDLDLSARGPAACPAESRIGAGMTEGLFFFPFSDDVLFDHFKHNIYLMNNKDEQIILVESEGFTVVRGHFQPDGSLEFKSPTCFPAPPAGECADDYILQLGTTSLIPRYKRDGRSYATTPPTCPKRGYWRSKLHFEWSDGAVDDVVSRQPCKGRRASRR